MCDIYRNSVLTITASCSASDCAGFLRERIIDDPIELDKPLRLQSVRFRQAVDHSRMLRDDPIHSRAWTFQETILPRRLLSFGSQEATWECETLRQCECRQIEFGKDIRTNPNELGRAAYRKYTRAVIEGQFHVRNKYDLPSLGTHLQSYAVGPSQSKFSVIQRLAEGLLAEAPAVENYEYRRYIIRLCRRKIRNIITTSRTSSDYFDAFAGTDPEPNLQRTLSSSSHDSSGELDPEVGPACEDWLENTCLNALVVNTFYRYWRRVLVPEYTRRALSNDRDRLIALQAIASDIHSGIHDRYLAGLWEGDLVNQLCWQSQDSQGPPADNQSPSWSWSSIRGPIIPFLAEEFEDNSADTEKMTIIKADCRLAGEKPGGRILGGSILLVASGMDVRYVRNAWTGCLDFYADAWRLQYTETASSTPLKLEFSPDTPLGCGPGGSLIRSADSLDARHADRAMSAILLLVKRSLTGQRCVIVCNRVSAWSNHCRRIGIGIIREMSLEASPSRWYRDEFVLV